MHELRLLLPLLPALLLHVVRATAFFAVVPLFGSQGDSRMLRLALGMALATIFWWISPKLVPVAGLAELALLAAREALVGIAAGYAVSLLTAALVTAGEVVSNEMGFSMAQVLDPLTGKSSPVTASLFEVMGYLLLFGTSLHHDVLRVLAASYDLLPVGKGFDLALVHGRLSALVTDSIEYGLRYAVPILAVMSLLTAALVILARAVPNLNLMEFSWGLRILLALLAACWFLAEGRPFLLDMFADLLQKAQGLFRPA